MKTLLIIAGSAGVGIAVWKFIPESTSREKLLSGLLSATVTFTAASAVRRTLERHSLQSTSGEVQANGASNVNEQSQRTPLVSPDSD